eukprot:scaffold2741_cov134-Isochrysis_galbana.AAC.10
MVGAGQRRAVRLLLLLGVGTAPLAGFHLTSPSVQLRRPHALTRRVAAPRCRPEHRPADQHSSFIACRQQAVTFAHSHAVRRLATGQRERIHAQLCEHENGCGRNDSSSNDNGLVAGSALAASALIFEALQVAGTAVVFVIAQRYTETSSPAEVREAIGPRKGSQCFHFTRRTHRFAMWRVHIIAASSTQVGAEFTDCPLAFRWWDCWLAICRAWVIPVAAAFVLTVASGAIFGPAKGVAVVLMCSTISATISFLLARTFGRSLVLQAARESPTYQTLDKAFSHAGCRAAFKHGGPRTDSLRRVGGEQLT